MTETFFCSSCFSSLFLKKRYTYVQAVFLAGRRTSFCHFVDSKSNDLCANCILSSFYPCFLSCKCHPVENSVLIIPPFVYFVVFLLIDTVLLLFPWMYILYWNMNYLRRILFNHYVETFNFYWFWQLSMHSFCLCIHQ